MASMASFFALKATQIHKLDESKKRDDSMKKITAKAENDDLGTRLFPQPSGFLSKLFSTATTAAECPKSMPNEILKHH